MNSPGTSTKERASTEPRGAVGRTEGVPDEVVKLKLDPYDGPRSFHASRAFAEYQAKMVKVRSRRKFGFVLVTLVLGGALLIAAIVLASQLL